MGAVYLAEDQRLVGRRCAIKENRSDPGARVEVKTQTREQFLAEANVLARLDHPSLPKVSDYFIENDREYLVMDYVEGEDLESRLQRYRGPLPEADVLNWADQVLDALAYLHNQRAQPIIHRDIKPANLRVNLQGRVKLVDFGLVKLLDTNNPATKLELRGVGTPAYAPLEQFAGSDDHTDARSDIYGLGATLYHLLTNLSPPDVHQRLLNPEILLPPRQLNVRLSEDTERVVLQAMAIYPSQRFQTAEAMQQAFKQSGASPPAKKAKRAGSPVTLWLFGLLGLVLVLIILGSTYFLLFGGQGPNDATTQQGANPMDTGAAEQATATPTEIIVQALGDAPTNAPTKTPTLVIQSIPPTPETPTGDTIRTATNTPTTEPTSEPTTEINSPPVAPSGSLLASTLVGTIAYSVFNGSSYDIYFGQADGSGSEFFLAEASQPAFSPDGSKIAYHSWKIDARGLITMELSGANPERVATFFEDQLPTWTPNGAQIILLSRRSGSRLSELIRVESSTEGSQGTVFAEGEYPTVGPQGQLVFKGWGRTAPGLRVADLPFDNLRPLTDNPEDTAPAISPDGQQVAFMSRRDGNWEIYVVNMDGSNLQRLTEEPAQDGLPTWSPDGKAIAFVSDRGGAWAVWAMTPGGADRRQLFAMPGSPDGFVGADTFASRGWAEERISWKK
jgi:serine/threonine-protein kinase